MKILLKILLFSQKSPELSENFSKIIKFWLFCKYFSRKNFHKSVNSCRFRKMLKNAQFLITIGVDIAENEPVSDSDVLMWVCCRALKKPSAREPARAIGSKVGSFSAVSTPLIARVGAFFSIFRNLQECHTFAPLHFKILRYFAIFRWFFQNFTKNCGFLSKSSIFRFKFHGILPELREIAENCRNIVNFAVNFWKFW